MATLELPGGLLLDGEIRRDYAFKPITGCLERAIAESGDGIRSLAEQVTGILVNAIDRVAGKPATKELVRALCSGDREYLMVRLQAAIDPDPQWLTLNCQVCHEPVQFQLQAGMLPVKSAGAEFPQATATLSIGDVAIRVPTGADEEALARGARDHQSAMNLLLPRLLSLSKESGAIDALNTDDQQLIDTLLEQMSPQTSHSVSISCPYCEHQQELPIDNYAWIVQQSRGLDEEIHTLAFHYHWSEKEILSLPKKRRKHYIKLIERSLGKYQDSDHNYDIRSDRQ